MPPAPALALASFVLGLLFGSFLNVCIVRLPAGGSIVRPPSHCPACNTPLRWYDNLPMLSWLFLRGRCRQCGASISWRYPAVELATALWFVLAGSRLWHGIPPGFGLKFALDVLTLAALGFLLIGLLVMDWRTHTLPDEFTLGGTALGFLLTCVRAALLDPGQQDIHFTPRHNLRLSSPGSFVAKGDVFLTGAEHVVLFRLGAILGAAGVLLLIRASYKALRGRDGMGLGDAKLLALIAAFLGFGDAMLSFFAGMIACTLWALTLLARRRATATTRLPLGSFLAAGGLFTALVGEAILTWYTGLI